MKTFGEAWATISRDKPLIYANLQECLPERMKNKDWVAFILLVKNEMLNMALAAKTESGRQSAIDSALHTCFDIGVLVGMEMEKSTDDPKSPNPR